jgi:trehalose 6-phosphate synthase/phosphatase
MKIDFEKKLIVVSNRLPYYQEDNQNWKRASGGLINAIEPIIIQTGGTWLGWDGNSSDSYKIGPVNELSSATKHLPPHYQIGRIPLTAEEVQEYYNQFSNETLWALFHYFFEKCAINESSWQTYQLVNQRFAEYIDQAADEHDIVWIHDYHLMLVPGYLKQIRPDLKTHFFLHIPFPHVDIYSILPWGNDILESLNCCHSIGFHHSSYLKNFKGAIDQILTKPVRTHSFVNPISIDYELFDATSRKESVIQRKNEFRNSLGDVKILIGVDRIDYSKGISERLQAIEKLLQTHPELKGKFVYYQLTIPSRENVPSYQELKKEVDELVGRINGSFSNESWSPIYYHYGTASFEELVAQYLAADIALVTPLRDGMNLVCKEYIAAHSDEEGILILSKFAGAFSEIEGCLAINPYSIEDIQNALFRAIHMPKNESQSRMRSMRNAIKSHDISHWWSQCTAYFNPLSSLQPNH